MKLEAITLKEERKLFSLNENEPMEYGCIGHLCGDFGGSGKEYYSTWFDHTCKHLNDAKCKAIGNTIIRTLNSDGNVMSSRSDMYNFCYPREDCKIDGIYKNMTWGFRIFTEDYAFYLKCTPVCGDYNFYLYVYDIFYLHYEAPPEEQNFAMVMELLRNADVDEENEAEGSVLDALFMSLERRNPDHIAVKYYSGYHKGTAKTLKSVQVTLAARLEKFNLDSLASLTITDELDLKSLGERKVALFALIPDNDASFNFLVSILYTQLFQQLFYEADHVHGGSLPMHVHFMMDEFANVSLPDDFDKILSVMRSRGLSVSIILQNLAQLKALFEKQWESIVGNCDEFVYLGGNEHSTHKYVSELLGKETIDTNSYGRSDGLRGNFSTNYQVSGRELMTPDEVSRLDNKYAIVFIRGERPVLDLKYDIMLHPNIELGTDGGAEAYVHNNFTVSGGIGIEIIDPDTLEDKGEGEYEQITERYKDEYAVYEDEELDKLCKEIEKKSEKEKKENAKKQESNQENANADGG